VEIGGYRISAGNHVFFSPYAVNRDPALYAEPDRFAPDRWRSDFSQRGSSATFLPFGAGIRSCIGERFAWTAMLITMSTIMARWILSPIADRKVRTTALGSLRPIELSMRLQERARC
jgi:cytochrome P450